MQMNNENTDKYTHQNVIFGVSIKQYVNMKQYNDNKLESHRNNIIKNNNNSR